MVSYAYKRTIDGQLHSSKLEIIPYQNSQCTNVGNELEMIPYQNSQCARTWTQKCRSRLQNMKALVVKPKTEPARDVSYVNNSTTNVVITNPTIHIGISVQINNMDSLIRIQTPSSQIAIASRAVYQ